MMSSGIRASDHDRDRTARLLREHHAVGRLDPEEFAERLDKSFQAKTVEDLERLTADLPAIDLYPLPTASLPKNRAVSTDLPAASVFGPRSASGSAGFGAAESGRFTPGWLTAWGSWSALFLIAFVLWVVGAGSLPLIGMAAVGAIMGARWIMGPRSLGSGSGRSGRRSMGGGGAGPGGVGPGGAGLGEVGGGGLGPGEIEGDIDGQSDGGPAGR